MSSLAFICRYKAFLKLQMRNPDDKNRRGLKQCTPTLLFSWHYLISSSASLSSHPMPCHWAVVKERSLILNKAPDPGPLLCHCEAEWLVGISGQTLRLNIAMGHTCSSLLYYGAVMEYRNRAWVFIWCQMTCLQDVPAATWLSIAPPHGR